MLYAIYYYTYYTMLYYKFHTYYSISLLFHILYHGLVRRLLKRHGMRLKVVLELSYLGSRFVGWQPQAPRVESDLPGPCRHFNRGRCKKGDGCRSAACERLSRSLFQ